MQYIFIDEITYIDSWYRALKFLADAGYLDTVLVLLTGSDMLFLKEMIKRLPGRRGASSTMDFHYYPLSFKEYLLLRKSFSPAVLNTIQNNTLDPNNEKCFNQLYKELENYVITGGYLTAINDFALHNDISPATQKTYVDWIHGDFLKRNKNEHYLDEILSAIIKRYGSQVTWNSLGKDVTIQHHQTISDYCEALQSMDALFIQSALREDKLTGAPKKAKKLYFTDPFIVRSICTSLNMSFVAENLILEGLLITHLRRCLPTYYIKTNDGGEIDIAYIESKKIMPIEIKWSDQLKPVHLKWLKKYKNSILGAKVKKVHTLEGITIVPLPYLLLKHSHD